MAPVSLETYHLYSFIINKIQLEQKQKQKNKKQKNKNNMNHHDPHRLN